MPQQKTLTLTQAADVNLAYCHELEEVELTRPAAFRMGRGEAQSIVLNMEELRAIVHTLTLVRVTHDASVPRKEGAK